MLLLRHNFETGEGDLVREDGILQAGADVTSLAYVSLFTDARARDDDPVREGETPRGYWADSVDEDDTSPTGSRLWLLQRFGATQRGARFAHLAAREALQWMTDVGLIEDLDVQAEAIPSRGMVTLSVYAKRPGELAPSLLGAWAMEINNALP